MSLKSLKQIARELTEGKEQSEYHNELCWLVDEVMEVKWPSPVGANAYDAYCISDLYNTRQDKAFVAVDAVFEERGWNY